MAVPANKGQKSLKYPFLKETGRFAQSFVFHLLSDGNRTLNVLPFPGSLSAQI